MSGSKPAANPLRTLSPPPPPPSAPLNNDNDNQQPSVSGAQTRASSQPTPATVSRQPVGLAVLSNLWGDSTTSAPKAQPIVSDDTVPAIFTHAPLLDAQDGPSDLTASTGSVPSTTTTLTNTLPPTQSAALRALNAPAFHSSPAKTTKSAKSTSSRTTVTSQPVVVRTYSASRHASRPTSGFSTPRSFAMNGHGHGSFSALTAGLANKNDQLPSPNDFSFSAILRAVDPEIRDAIDAIAEICARSRMSLADEYDAHLPPQGEITGGGVGWAASTGALVGRGRLQRVTQGWTATENTLMAVPEASSSSERLAQEGRMSSSRQRSQSAYGSLKSVISGGSGKRKAIDGDTFREQVAESSSQVDAHLPRGPAWAVQATSSSQSQPAITLVTTPTASKQLSLASPTALGDLPEADTDLQTRPGVPSPYRNVSDQRGAVNLGLSSSHSRAGPLRSITSWLPWLRLTDLESGPCQGMTRAESILREMLLSSQNVGKGKATATAFI